MDIPIPFNDRRISYAAVGGETNYSTDFPLNDQQDLEVVRVRSGITTTLTITTHYIVSISASTAYATITLQSAALAGDVYILNGDMVAERVTDLAARPNADTMGDLNEEYDRIWMALQELGRDALTVSATFSGTLGEISGTPAAADIIRRNAANDGFEFASLVGSGVISVPVSVAQGGTGGTTGNTALTNLTATRSETGATAVPVLSKLREIISAKDFGATGDGTTDDTTALNNWLAAGGGFLPAGTYKTSAPLTITVSNTIIRGDGYGKSIISCSDNDTVGISIASALSFIELCDFKLTRSVTAIAGGHGIAQVGSVSQCHLSRLVVEKQYIGLSLLSTDFSTIRDCIVQQCQSDGVKLTNTAASGAVQWQIDNVLSAQNVGRGFLVASTAGPSSVSVGTYSKLSTFANTGIGFLASGLVGVPIHGLRLDSCFFGEDGDTELNFDTYGGYHQIRNCHLELSGSRTTGPTLATAASNTGDGISLSANNLEVEVIGCDIDGHSLNGIRTSATKLVLIGTNITNNGRVLTAGERCGVKFVAGTALVTGNRMGNRSGTSQDVGIVVNVDSTTLVGNDLSGNNSNAATFTVTPPVLSAIYSNLGLTTQNIIGDITRAGVKVLSTRITGWAAATNTKSKATFDTTTVTLPNLAARVGQIIDDLIAHGIIGA